MGDMLSQAEIDALLSGASADEDSNTDVNSNTDVAQNTSSDDLSDLSTETLSSEEEDALGEIGNISMGTSATTLFTLLGQRVNITTPKVEITTWDKMSKQYNSPYVAVEVQYTEGLSGANLLILKEEDVKVITDLMMGGDGTGNKDSELTELHLSAIGEAMNQMVGSSSTSLSTMFDKKVDISPPKAQIIHLQSDKEKISLDLDKSIVKIAFDLKVGDLVDSEIMQILPMEFAKELVDNLLNSSNDTNDVPQESNQNTSKAESVQANVNSPNANTGYYTQPPQPNAGYGQQVPPQPNMGYGQQVQPQPNMGYGQQVPPQPNMGYGQSVYQQPTAQPVNVQPAQFESFDFGNMEFDKQNINLLMDVPLQITVELGRTKKKIREILEFGQGSIIELDKLSGEPVDILVNGKNIAKGEVVVIDESFGVRITDILHPSKRL